MRIKLGIPLKLRMVKRILNSPISGDDDKRIIEYVSTDTRELSPGDLFFPLKGDKLSGERFVKKAKEIGGITVSAENSLADITVKDTGEALLLLAEKYRSLIKLRHRIAITGSVGKTTTKELVSKILGSKFRIHATEGNLNNEIGVPLTILSAPEDTEILVIEAGMNHKGELSRLSKCINPTIAVITSIGTAHIGNLGSERAIEEAKGEIADYLTPCGVLIAPRECAYFQGMKNLITTSYKTEDASFCTRLNSDGSFSVRGGRYSIDKLNLSLSGEHIRRCMSSVAAVADVVGLSEGELISSAREIVKLCSDKKVILAKGLILIDDSYNASYESIKCSIESELKHGDLSLCLGDILELGDYTRDIHRSIGALCKKYQIKRLYLFGAFTTHIKDGALEAGVDENAIFINEDLNNPEKTAVQILKTSKKADRILFKASHKTALSRIIKIIESM